LTSVVTFAAIGGRIKKDKAILCRIYLKSMIFLKIYRFCRYVLHKSFRQALLRSLTSYWQNRSFQLKLSIMLILSAVLPTILATQGIILVAKHNLQASEAQLLKKGLADFQYHVEQIKKDHEIQAQVLQIRLEQAKINTSNLKIQAQEKEVIENIINNPINSEYQPSFYLFTDSKGKTIAHNVKTISNFDEDLHDLRVKSKKPDYQSNIVPVGVDTTGIELINNVLIQKRLLSGVELLPSQLLEKIGLHIQADIGYHQQPIDNLPISQQPFPIGTYNTENGRIGLSIIAVQPVTINNNFIGTVIVGTLLNQNYQLVDEITKISGVATATLFAYDWRVSTNVPNNQGNARAVGTRVARIVAETVLEQKKTFIGQVNIVGKPYRAAYTPIYSHSYQNNQSQAKPIGIYYVGNPETKIQQTLTALALTGYGIGGGFILVAIVVIIAVARAFSYSIRELTKFAQSIGRGELHVHLQPSKRRDEIGILENELNDMAHRIANNIETMAANEIKIRASAQELQDTLEQLKITQTQLVQNAKMSGLENLVAGVAHEINNPVSFIYGNIFSAEEYIQDLIYLIELYQSHYPNPLPEIDEAIIKIDFEFLQEDVPQVLDSMKNGAQRIRQIVESLRTFSRMDEAEYKLVNLHNNINCILDLINYKLLPRKNFPGIKIIKNYQPIPEIECYACLLNQVFMNILNNAVDSLEEAFAKKLISNPKIKISTKIKQVHQKYIQIIISDNGVGIPNELQQSIFDPFFTTKTVGKGTGMGLATSYQIIREKHDGSLKCVSTSGNGASFMIEIPIKS
jgi:signal transduction histidine kinase